jgi:hypothetical protein
MSLGVAEKVFIACIGLQQFLRRERSALLAVRPKPVKRRRKEQQNQSIVYVVLKYHIPNNLVM